MQAKNRAGAIALLLATPFAFAAAAGAAPGALMVVATTP
jgi:hypothetical protein